MNGYFCDCQGDSQGSFPPLISTSISISISEIIIGAVLQIPDRRECDGAASRG